MSSEQKPQTDHQPSGVASNALLGDPFISLPIRSILEVRNEALNHMDGSCFEMHGYTFTMPGALIRANSRLMLGGHPPNPSVDARQANQQTKEAR